MAKQPKLSSEERSKIVRVIVWSLLLDLISFTFILPLFPKLLEFYRDREAPSLLLKDASEKTLLQLVLGGLNTYKEAFSRPIDSRYDIILLGGAMGSLFSLLQALASPTIGRLSDKYGRRKALLASMIGNILSVLLWVAAVDFRTFILSRIVGGLSEGNVQLATAMASDISDSTSRSSTMAMVGACFSVAFTVGPALGAFLSTISTFSENPFATAAGFSLLLLVIETIYLYRKLPETLPSMIETKDKNESVDRPPTDGNAEEKPEAESKAVERTNSFAVLNVVHFIFLLFFSGMESSLTFLCYELFEFTPGKNGRLLAFIGFTASIFQGFYTRKIQPIKALRIGVGACLTAFTLLGRISDVWGLYLASFFLAVTSATVVTSLNALASFEAKTSERGTKLGNLRSWGQLGRGLGPILFTSVYWWAGREYAYNMGAVGILVVSVVVMVGIQAPKLSEAEEPRK